MFASEYSDNDLVCLYDSLNSATEDHEFYLQIPEDKPQCILDIGCGTGVLAIGFANDGHKVTGIDPALAMIEFAKNREGGSSVEWLCSLISECYE